MLKAKILNGLLVLLLLHALMIYTSLFKFVPWYEPCGIQFLALLLFSVPGCFAIGLVLVVLRKSAYIKKFDITLPFVAAFALPLPILFDWSLSKATISIGIFLSSVLSLLAMYRTFYYKEKSNEQ